MGFNEVEKTFEDGHVVTFKRIGMSEFYENTGKLSDPVKSQLIVELQENLKAEGISEGEKANINRKLNDMDIEADLLIRRTVLSKVLGIKKDDLTGTKEDAILYVDMLLFEKIFQLYKELRPDFEKNLPSQS